MLSETLQFEYHPEIPHHLERILDAEGQVAQQLVYDAEGRMVLNCAADGSCVETDHDLRHLRVLQTKYNAAAVLG